MLYAVVYTQLFGVVVFLQPLIDTEFVERRLHFADARVLQLDVCNGTRWRHDLNESFIETGRQTAVRTQPAQFTSANS